MESYPLQAQEIQAFLNLHGVREQEAQAEMYQMIMALDDHLIKKAKAKRSGNS